MPKASHICNKVEILGLWVSLFINNNNVVCGSPDKEDILLIVKFLSFAKFKILFRIAYSNVNIIVITFKVSLPNSKKNYFYNNKILYYNHIH